MRQRSEKAKSVKDEKERKRLEALRLESVKKEKLRVAFKVPYSSAFYSTILTKILQ